MAVTCAIARSIVTLGWKYTRMTATPLYDCDSMWSMSFTVVVMERSAMVTMRFAMSLAESPL
jgi:hypothetical protein